MTQYILADLHVGMECEGEFHKIDSKHHMTRVDYCLGSHHQVYSKYRS